MFAAQWRRLIRSFATVFGIWYITHDMSPKEVVDAAIKKWDKSSIALFHLLQTTSPGVNVLYASCILWGRCHIEPPGEHSSPLVLRKLLESLPEYQRTDAFTLAVNNDAACAASLLCQFSHDAISGLAPIARNIATQWGNEPRHDDLALTFYQSLPAYGAPQDEAKWLFVRALVARGLYAQAEPLLLGLAQKRTSPDLLWLLIRVLQASQRPHQQLLEAVHSFIEQAPPSAMHVNQAWNIIKDLYETMLNNGTENERLYYLRTIHRLLEHLPEKSRATALTFITGENDVRTAHILASFTSQVLAGFENLINTIVEKWDAEYRSDDLALRFYQSLPAYRVPQEKVDWLLARAFVARKQYDSAEPLLQRLSEVQPSPDGLGLLAGVLHALRRSPHLLLETLLKFTRIACDDTRVGWAWKTIGDLYGEQLGDGVVAVKAYQVAETYGIQMPQLLAYRIGNWDAIPALRVHPDYAYPLMTVIDLEVDPHPEAKPGERVFEVAAVRIKGKTMLREYQTFIRRSFRPAKMKTVDELAQAPDPEQVASDLRVFIGESLVVGHNLRAFDADQLRGMGVPIQEQRIIDTLTFARLLYPDSLRHNLALLCYTHHIEIHEGAWHNALPDAQACASLFHALCDELIHRGGMLLTGIRALVTPDSAFDRAILQPRNLVADPHISWSLDPTPSVVHALVPSQGLPASVSMQKALRSSKNVLVELHDPEGAYITQLPEKCCSIVTVNSLSRLEHMLAVYQHKEEIYVLPDPRTILCPQRLRLLIENAKDSEYKVLLFCLYQASHNKDARTLYPMRLPTEEPELLDLRKDLMRACCSADTHSEHHTACPTTQAHLNAYTSHHILLATHETFTQQGNPPQADLIVIDDIAELQMHLAEYVAERISSDQVQSWTLKPAERLALTVLQDAITTCVQANISQPGYHERLSLRTLTHHFINRDTQEVLPVLTQLEQAGTTGKKLTEKLQCLCSDATRDAKHPEDLHAYWIDLWFSDSTEKVTIERWAICGVNRNLPATFTNIFWHMYKQHIICGTALSTHKNNVVFLERSLGLPQKLPLLKDARPKSRVYVPTADVIPPAGFLRRRSWAMQVGAYLYTLQAQSQARSLLVTLNNSSVVHALASAFQKMRSQVNRQVLATQSGWTITKIAERVTDPERHVLAMVAPRIRHTYLHSQVDIEVTGPLQFLHQQDPLVAAHMRVFAHRYQAEGPFTAYVLPQALLELKSRLASNAEQHIILDSRLHTQVYRDEVFAMLNDIAIVEQQDMPEISVETRAARQTFLDILSLALAVQGMEIHDDISDGELLQALRAIWNIDDFRPFKLDGNTQANVTQKNIVCAVLEGKDQLLVAATGGGKSLCYQLPAVLLAEEMPPKVTLVFSPLIALMSNQVDDLRRKGIFSAIVLNSTLSTIQRQEHLRGLQRGEYSIVYVASEQIRSSSLRRALEKREIGLIAVDEAHCLSQWGHDFRTDYFAVKDWIQRLSGGSPRQFPILALTATARKGYRDAQEQERSDQTSTIQDIIEKLGLKNMTEQEAVITSPQRSELEFSVEQIVPAPYKCTCGGTLELKESDVKCRNCGNVRRVANSDVQEAVEKTKLSRIADLLNDASDAGLRQRWDKPSGKRQKGLIYCAYRKTTTLVAEELKKCIPGLRIAAYSAELDATEREDVLQRFTHDDEDGLDIVVATNAFGMGIDVRRLGFVIHFDTPGTLEAYYQEAGRAGRDKMFGDKKEKARCILLYHPSDLDKQRYLSRKNSITQLQVEEVYDVLSELWRDVVGKHQQQAEDTPIEYEVIFTEQEIATRAGISTDNVPMALYYLEYHTFLNGKPILGRGETANRVLRIKFERDYKQQCVILPETSLSQPLLRLFRESEEYGLNEDTTMAISLKELSANLGLQISAVEREILNLVQRRIITYDCDGHVKWTHDAEHTRKVLHHLKQDITTLLSQIATAQSKRKKHGTQAFSAGETAYVDMNEYITKYHLRAVAPHLLLRFLSALSHSDGVENELRLFQRFTRNARYGQPGKFELRLWTENNCKPSIRLNTIFTAFQETVSLLERLPVTNEERVFDLLAIQPNIHQRQLLHQQLLLLDMLDLLKYTSDPSLGLALRVTFKQQYTSKEQLTIDLSTLRLKETYEKNKLKLMARYATEAVPETRAEEFKTYFYGEKPLVEQVSQIMRTDLTQEQQALVALEQGYHLIEGPAGSGKTTTLVEFIKHLVCQKQIPIDRIMVTTHYNVPSTVSRKN